MQNDNKEHRRLGSCRTGKFLSGLLITTMSLSAAAQEPQEILDNVLEDVYAFTDGRVVRLDQDTLTGSLFVEQVDVRGADFRACELSAAGLVCLQGTEIVVYDELTEPDPAAAMPFDQLTDADIVNTGTVVADCADANLPFNTKKGEPCTSATVKPDGKQAFLGGRGNGQGNELVHLVPKPEAGTCADVINSAGVGGYAALAINPDQCFLSLAEGRPVIITLEALSESSSLYPGVLVLEARTNAVIVEENQTVTPLGGSKEFGLTGKERLTGLTALQLPEEIFGPESENDFVLGTTTEDAVIALSTDNPASPRSHRVYDIAASRTARGLTENDQCASFTGPRSPITVGIETDYVYVTDGLYCELHILKAVAPNPATGFPFELKLVDIEPISTTIDGTEFALAGVTTLPGNGVDFGACASLGTCGIIPDTPNVGNGLDDIRANGLQIDQTQGKFGIAYLIKNWPDCRYIPATCVQLEQFVDQYTVFNPGDTAYTDTSNQVLFLINEGIILPEPSNPCDTPPYAAGACDPLLPYPNPDTEIGGNFEPGPGGWRQNQRPLIPQVIIDALGRPLPDAILTSRFWRCQAQNDFICEALFVDAEDVVVTNLFEVVYEPEEIVTSGLGNVWSCKDFVTDLQDALETSLVTTVSENYRSGSDPFDYLAVDEYRDTLSSVFECGSEKTLRIRWSLDFFTLEKTPCSVRYSANEPWRTDGTCGIGGAGEFLDDAVFIKLLLSLWSDWGDVAENFACAVADGQVGVQPLLQTDCDTQILPTYGVATDKLYKCWDALQRPKQSALDQNCQAWLSQFNNLRSDVEAAILLAPQFDNSTEPGPADPANRKYELLMRLAVMESLWERRVIPTIQADGFIEPQPQ